MNKVVGYIFFTHEMQRGFRLSVNGIDSHNLKFRLTQRLQQTFPNFSFLIGMMKSKNQQPVLRKSLMDPGKDICQILVESLDSFAPASVLNYLLDLRRVLRRKVGIPSLED
jgi:hypothetical protein